jgi:hypothetical protein
MRLDAVQPGIGVDDVVEATAFELVMPPTVQELAPPSEDELVALRHLRQGEEASVPEGVAAG